MAGPIGGMAVAAPGLKGMTDEEVDSKMGFNDIFGEVMGAMGKTPTQKSTAPGLPSSRSTPQAPQDIDTKTPSEQNATATKGSVNDPDTDTGYGGLTDPEKGLDTMNEEGKTPAEAGPGPGATNAGTGGDSTGGGQGTGNGSNGVGNGNDAGSGTAGAGQSGEGGQWKKGGYTGAGDPDNKAGTVHKDEFVLDQQDTDAIGLDRLNAMRRITKSDMPHDKKMAAIGQLFTSKLALMFPKEAA